MEPPTVEQLLHAWERGVAENPLRRTLTLLSLTAGSAATDDLARLTVGERDARLLELRQSLFGSRLEGVSVCPACGQRIEFEFDAEEVKVNPSGAGTNALRLEREGYELEFRLPNSLDLLSLDGTGDVASARAQLLQNCLLNARREGESITSVALPENIVAAIGERMAEVDQAGDFQLSLRCPACEHAWLAAFDIGGYFWAEVHAWATRLLQEIHELASAYGWCETDILALSTPRRQAYLELIRA
jgi:hypothetical protein